MKKRRGVFILLTIGVLVFFGSWWGWEKIAGLLVFDNSGKYQEYRSKQGGYTVLIPQGWNPDEAEADGNFTFRVVISPGQDGYKAGNIRQLSITLIASASATQALSSQAEFDHWRSVDSQEIKGIGIIKLGNEQVDGKQAVRLAEVGISDDNPDRSFWSVTSWFRDGGENGYINMMGNGWLTEFELGIFSKILKSYSENGR